MKFSKKVALVILTVFLISVVAVGCSTAPKTETKPATEILVGADVELTGNAAIYGTSANNGMKLAVEDWNKAGGVLGKQIKLISADNKSDVGEVTNIANKLVAQDKVVALLGPITSTDFFAAYPVAAAAKIPHVATAASNAKVTVGEDGKVKEWAFRTCFIDPYQGGIAAKFAFEKLQAKTAVIYVDKNSDYSKGCAEVFAKEFVAMGGKILATEGFVTEDKDYRATLTKIKNMKPDLIYLPAYYEQVGLIVKQARELGYTKPILGGDGYDSSKLKDIATPAALQNVFFCNPYFIGDTDPRVQKFIADFKAKYGSVPDANAALGYDAANMLFDAMKRAGSTDGTKVRDALAATKNLPSIAGAITLDEFHNPRKAVLILSFDKDGNYTLVERINP